MVAVPWHGSGQQRQGGKGAETAMDTSPHTPALMANILRRLNATMQSPGWIALQRKNDDTVSVRCGS